DYGRGRRGHAEQIANGAPWIPLGLRGHPDDVSGQDLTRLPGSHLPPGGGQRHANAALIRARRVIAGDLHIVVHAAALLVRHQPRGPDFTLHGYDGKKAWDNDTILTAERDVASLVPRLEERTHRRREGAPLSGLHDDLGSLRR